MSIDDTVQLSQPDLLNKLFKNFQKKIEGKGPYDTPAPPGSHVLRADDDAAKLTKEEQQEYRSGVGSLLYLLKHSRPDLSNAVRELSKSMDGATEAHQKLLYRAIRFVSDTRDWKLLLEPKKQVKWEIKAYSDSDFAGDADTRRSVSGYVVYLMGCPIAWRSKGQKSVTLSSTEAEYVALSELSTEVLFIRSILEFLGLDVEYPIIVHVDNIGAVYLANSACGSNRTKHVDTRYHFVREYVEDGILKIIYVKSDDNDADVMTKNIAGQYYHKHADSIMRGGNKRMIDDDENRKGVKMCAETRDVVFTSSGSSGANETLGAIDTLCANETQRQYVTTEGSSSALTRGRRSETTGEPDRRDFI